MPHAPDPVHAAPTFTFDGTNLLYADFPRIPAKDLKYLLARGSGYVIRGKRMTKLWFQAQCAHYGLPTSGTLAALRNNLELFLASPLPEVPRDLLLLEKQKRDEHARTTTSISLQEKISADKPQNEKVKTEGRILPNFFGDIGDPAVQLPAPTQAVQPLVDKTNISPTPTPVVTSPKKPSLPRAKLAAVVKFTKAVRLDPVSTENALQEIKLRMGWPEPTSGTDTESEEEDDSLGYSDFGSFTPRFPHQVAPRRTPRNFVPFTADVVSGRWELCVTYHTMSPLPAPWRTASSKWLKGEMNVQLVGDGRSLTGEFALLGLNGKFKSRKCDLRADGISAWVRFVAQMPIATVKPVRGQTHKEHNLTFGPSETQYGYLRFHSGNRVGGMLRCRKYGKLEFTGIKLGGPVDMAWNWKSFIEGEQE